MNTKTSKLIQSMLVRGLTRLDFFLEKAEEWAKEQGKENAEVISLRLAPDMYPLIKQVQIASDNAKAIMARVAGVEIPTMADEEVTIADLHERISKTLAFIGNVTLRDDSEIDTISATFPWYPGKQLLGMEYIFAFGIPNFYFHVTTAYGILRSNGVSLGKADFIGNLDWKDL